MQTDFQICNRRRFLQESVAIAAYGLASPIAANDVESGNVVDTHVYVGRWPLRRLAGDEPSSLVANLRDANVSQAWAGSFDGMFHKDVHDANQRLVETCRNAGEGLLIPFGTINPALPDWEEDLRRCQEVLKMSGVRLHPNYHGYTLDDLRFSRLLEFAAARNLIVQLVAWMSDERSMLLMPRVPQIDMRPLAKLVEPMRQLRLVVTNGICTAPGQAIRSLARLPHVYFDFAQILDGRELQKLIELVPPERLVLGSTAPLFGFERSSSKLQNTNLPPNQIRGIRGGTARRLIKR